MDTLKIINKTEQAILIYDFPKEAKIVVLDGVEWIEEYAVNARVVRGN